MAEDYYNEELDQESTVAEGADKAEEDAYETFLAPKSAFAGKDLEVGTVHRVKIVRSLDSELELRCIEGDGEEEAEPAMAEPENELYQ